MNKSSSDLIDAKLEEHQLCGSKHCPSCGHKLQGKPDWVGLPAGVKFDPTDQELIEHLEAKVKAGKESRSHPLIDEFIPTIHGEDGICYTHPEKLPGVTKDGLSRHFFHRPSKAYTTGTRKRRKIQTECDLRGGETRWHKTGKTRPVMMSGKQKGCKKILVLYTNFGKNRKPEKTSWVMHQYHLGQHEEEREGELVVSKIFYQTQPRQCNWSERTNNAALLGSSSSSVDHHSSSSFKEVATNINSHGSSPQDFAAVNNNIYANSGGSNAIDFQHYKHEQLSFLPDFRQSFEEGGNIAGKQEEADQMHQQMATAYHISRPSHSISTIVSPASLHHASIDILNQDHSAFHVDMLPNPNFQQQEQQQQEEEQQHKQMLLCRGRSASGLEELIMSCTSTDTQKQESSASMENPQESEWLKYSFWPDSDNHAPDRS